MLRDPDRATNCNRGVMLGDADPSNHKQGEHYHNIQSRARYQSQKKHNEGRLRTPHNNHNKN